MVPMRMSTIFKNRWMALLWAAGILWFAYDFAGSAEDGSDQNVAANVGGSASSSSDDANSVARALGN